MDDIAQGLLDGEDVDYWVNYLINRYKDGVNVAKNMIKKATIESMKEENIAC